MNSRIPRIWTGMNLKPALCAALQIGCTVSDKRRTGELVIVHPAQRKPCRVNGRRKDAPLHLVCWLRQLLGKLIG